MFLNSNLSPGLNKSDYYSKMRNSIFNKHKKSRDKSFKNISKINQTQIGKEDRDLNYTTKILEKRRRALQKNLSAQKLEKSSRSKLKKNVSLNRKNQSRLDDNSILTGLVKHQMYPKINGKKRRCFKNTSSLYNNMIQKNNLSKFTQSQSSNNLKFLSKKKFEDNSKIYESLKKEYSKGFHKSKGFLVTSENFINFKKRKNIRKRSGSKKQKKSSSKNYQKDRILDKTRKINHSLQYRQKPSFSNKVLFFLIKYFF